MDVNKLIETAEKYPAAVPDLPEVPVYVDLENPDVSSGSKVRRPWRIEDDGGAEWALRRKAEQDQEIARIVAQAEAAKRWIDRRAAQLIEEAQRGSNFFEAVLCEWMTRARGLILKGKAKSKKYLYGTIGLRAAPEKLVYDDEKATLAWARSLGAEAGLYRVEFLIEKDAVKAYAKANKMIPPGARWEGGDDRPYVKADAPALPAAPPAQLPTPPLSLVKETP